MTFRDLNFITFSPVLFSDIILLCVDYLLKTDDVIETKSILLINDMRQISPFVFYNFDTKCLISIIANSLDERQLAEQR